MSKQPFFEIYIIYTNNAIYSTLAKGTKIYIYVFIYFFIFFIGRYLGLGEKNNSYFFLCLFLLTWLNIDFSFTYNWKRLIKHFMHCRRVSDPGMFVGSCLT